MAGFSYQDDSCLSQKPKNSNHTNKLSSSASLPHRTPATTVVNDPSPSTKPKNSNHTNKLSSSASLGNLAPLPHRTPATTVVNDPSPSTVLEKRPSNNFIPEPQMCDAFEFPDEEEMQYMNELHGDEPPDLGPLFTKSLPSKSAPLARSVSGQLAPSRPPDTTRENQPKLTASTLITTPRPPALPPRSLVGLTPKEMDLETLYIKRHACITRVVVILQRMISVLHTGECDSGEDYGCLEHTKSYLDERLTEFNAEVEHRRSRGTTLETASPILSNSTKKMDTPLGHALPSRGALSLASSLTSISAYNSVQNNLKNDSVVLPTHHNPTPQISAHVPQGEARQSSPAQQTRSSSPRFDQFSKETSTENGRFEGNLPKRDANNSSHEHDKISANSPVHQIENGAPALGLDMNGLLEPDDLLEGIFSNDDDLETFQVSACNPNSHQPLDSPRHHQPMTSNLSAQNVTKTSNPIKVTEKATLDIIPAEDYSKKMQHPWSRDVGKALIKIFKLSTWRHNQLDAINTTLSGNHCFVLMPTGGGKSLCYQLPAVVRSGVTKGVTVVISPLISLITDQVQALCEKEIGAAAFTGTMSQTERDYVCNDLRSTDPALCLIYVTPEMIMRSGLFSNILRDLQSRGLLARFVFDEAHCVSQWGHDFRPDYKDVGPKLRKEYKEIPFMALTATANFRVQQDVMLNLGITGCRVLTQSFNRANLRYEVRPKTKEVLNDIIRIITVDHHGQSGIIYCLSKKQCEEVAGHLSLKHKIKAHHYHAGMSKDDRQNVQYAWQSGKLQVICATIAFGMGIDKADVRFVVHYSMPSSLEGYYQETGRAGRDGKISECVLFYAYRDFTAFMRLVEQTTTSRDQMERQQANARQVIGFCLNKLDCRRSLILSYFGEKFAPEQCRKTCDTCLNPEQSRAQNVTELVKGVIKLVKQLSGHGSSVTMAHCVDVFKGSKNKKVIDSGHDKFEGAGLGSNLDRTDAERLFHLMVAKDILIERFETNAMGFVNAYIQLAPGYQSFLAGKETLMLSLGTNSFTSKRNSNVAPGPPRPVTVLNSKRKRNDEKSKGAIQDSDEDWQNDSDEVEFLPETRRNLRSRPDPPLRGAAKKALNPANVPKRGTDLSEIYFKELLALRSKLNVNSSDLPLDILQTLACLRPQTREALLGVSGLTQRIADKYGNEFLKIFNKPSTSSNGVRNENKDYLRSPSKRSSMSNTTSFHKHMAKFAAGTNTSTTNKVNVPRSTAAHKGGITAMPIPR
ncbi:hypothetical protein O181_001821 [Austropuccinia psidii MF-1]|uniref:DNA 3'-5' helicase n=1 Tax=Austropuccinia psidii MF-1 TaxID=1389203 RepID=A0A9Q3BAY6_9BASI|nr:hypothetical protein [Austropuccinia psidii MF-1]